ncbi:hypothetical protein [Brevundimonas lenta]|uniref:Putative Co/Zn/Cd cation transporter (Cation efflux family) n=1 Tax=Brevundimonas lenta TaxID=424796 RepID=A0A7W6JA60_9CAUL|nr:hypothetical protein [Brevundimonas lenta]MBB4081322.1 putative Co/Zn/Cd cation transporter (cation efflux family) [Brevundimonas lenta]
MRPASHSSSVRFASVVAGLTLPTVALINVLLAGFKVNEAAGQAADAFMAITLIVGSALILAPAGRRRRLLAALAAAILLFTLWSLHARLSTTLDVRFGGAYGWSGTRTMVMTLIEGPVLAVLAAALTFGLAHLPGFNRDPAIA